MTSTYVSAPFAHVRRPPRRLIGLDIPCYSDAVGSHPHRGGPYGKKLTAEGKKVRYIRMCLFEAGNPQLVKELNDQAKTRTPASWRRSTSHPRSSKGGSLMRMPSGRCRKGVLKVLPAAVLVCLAFLPAPAGAAPRQLLYAADGAGGNPSNLYILDPSSGAVVRTVGPIGFGVTGLAVHPVSGTLYGTTGRSSQTSPGFLIRIDKTTGAGTVVGDLRADDETAPDITFTPDGTLYGWLEPGSDDLVTINPVTGAATVVGNSGLDTFGGGIAASAAGVLFLAGDGDGGRLHVIDRGTGAPREVAVLSGTGDLPIAAMAFDAADTLFGVRHDFGVGPSELITINQVTGAITVVGLSLRGLDAIAFDRETLEVKTDRAHVSFGKEPRPDRYDTRGRFVLSDVSDGIDPVAEAVVVRVGGSILTIPAGSFKLGRKGRRAEFEGVVEGVFVKARIEEIGPRAFRYRVRAAGVDLTDTIIPIDFGLNVGADFGTTTIPVHGELEFRQTRDHRGDDGRDDDD
jgi:hypothetical protein